MKKLLMLTTLMLTISITTVAQDSLLHLKFMGIPMNFDVKTFGRYLKTVKKFKKIKDTNHLTYQGEFSGFKDCIFVLQGNADDQISAVGVILPTEENFIYLSKYYDLMKKRLQDKYLCTPEVEEHFKDSIEPETNLEKMKQLKEGTATFKSTFFVQGGKIVLSMTSVEPLMGGYLNLLYMDEWNSIRDRQKTLDDL